ncbi:MAG: [Fe-Fe] hydrogenase large subunit C-terminal domain-containing protein, partial [Clostridia bacterium]|nr:[Fe-Fe] hydrogenase large subunit C-terminal domain-containing protein [Clostridia bacterium]
ISDKSYILSVVRMLKEAAAGGEKVYAVVAPAISSQFTYAKLGQVVTGLKALGFGTVMEAALGADMVAQSESRELAERRFLTSSCCPAFVSYVRKSFPNLAPYTSDSLSPMATIAKYIKENLEPGKVVFIGPCTAKKGEIQQDSVKPYVDAVLTFEELQALFDSRDLDITTLAEGVLDNASYFGRIFARCGGLSDAVAEALKEQKISFDLKPISCDGIEECRMALLKKSRNATDANFIEGMACVGGCIGGAGCLTHSSKSRLSVDQYSEQGQRSIAEAVANLLQE